MNRTLRSLSLPVVLLLLLSMGCAAWRDVTHGPTYRLVRRPRAISEGKLLYRKMDGTESIFRTLQSFPFTDDTSARMRARQESVAHKILRVPGGIAHVAYMIAASPFFLVSYLFALPVWYDTGNDATIAMKPEYWEEYPWYWTTRGFYVVDFIFHDVPFIAFAWPIRAISGKPYEWEEELEVEAFEDWSTLD